MSNSFERPLNVDKVLMLFRERYNTWDIAKMYSTDEPRVVRALHDGFQSERTAGVKRKPTLGFVPHLGRLGPEG